MIRVAIVEDEREQQELLQQYLRRFSEESGLEIYLQTFGDGDELVNQYDKTFDILLLDIQMQRLNGMKTAEIIRKTDENVIIIFITNLVQYAVQGYSVDAMNYVLKPINYLSFCDKFQRAVDRIEKRKPKLLLIKADQGLIQLEHSKISMVEKINRKLAVYADNQVYYFNQTLKNIVEELGEKQFFRCHVACLVNLKYVEKIDRNSAIVAGREVPVSRHHRKEFIEALTNHMREDL